MSCLCFSRIASQANIFAPEDLNAEEPLDKTVDGIPLLLTNPSFAILHDTASSATITVCEVSNKCLPYNLLRSRYRPLTSQEQ